MNHTRPTLRLHSLTLALLISVIFSALTLPNYAQDTPENPTVIVEGTNYTDLEIQELMAENAKWLLPGGKPNPDLVSAGFTPQKTDMSRFNWEDRSAVLSLAERMVRLKNLHEQNLALAKLAKELTAFRAQYAAVVTKLIEQMTSNPPEGSPTPTKPKSDDESAVPVKPIDKARINGTWPITLATLFGLLAFCIFVRERALTAAFNRERQTSQRLSEEVLSQEARTTIEKLQTDNTELKEALKAAALLHTEDTQLIADLQAENLRLANTDLTTQLAQLRREFETYQLGHQAAHDQLDANLSELNILLPIARQLALAHPDRADQILAGAADERRVRQLCALLTMLLTGQITEAQFAALDGLQDEYVDASHLPAYRGKPAGMTELKVPTILRKLAEASRPPS